MIKVKRRRGYGFTEGNSVTEGITGKPLLSLSRRLWKFIKVVLKACNG
jgi:hypothetical protein